MIFNNKLRGWWEHVRSLYPQAYCALVVAEQVRYVGMTGVSTARWLLEADNDN